MVALVGIIPELNIGPVFFTLFGYVQALAVINAHYLVIIAACLYQPPALLPGVVPTPLNNVCSVIISAALNGDGLAAVAADDGDFVVAQVYHIPVLIGLIRIAPLLDIGSVLQALLGHVQSFVTAPIHDWPGVTYAAIRSIGITITAIGTSITVIVSTAADFEIGAATTIHPDAGLIETPGSPLHTGGAAFSICQTDCSSIGIDRTGMAATIVGSTVDTLISVIAISTIAVTTVIVTTVV